MYNIHNNAKQGQYTEEEFKVMYEQSPFKGGYHTGKAWTKSGNTVNYFIQHENRSWTNYDCKTKYLY